jgi:hypothetical protein
MWRRPVGRLCAVRTQAARPDPTFHIIVETAPMNWLNSLLRKPPAPPPARTTPKRTAAPKPPPPDTAALRQALSGVLEPAERARQETALGHALGASLQAPLAEDTPLTWVAAVSHSADKSVALAWLEQVAGDDLLGEIACHGRFAEVRLAAAQRITDSATLESVARASKNKDKGVYRHCADLLRERRERLERLQHAAAIAAGLRKLLEHAPLSVSHLLELEREWKTLAGAGAAGDEAAATDGGGDALRDCQALLAQANARILAEAEAQRALHALGTAHDALATELGSGAWPAPEVLAAWQARHARLDAAVQALPEWLAASGTACALAAGLQSLGQRLAAWSVDSARMAALEQFLSSCAPAAHAAGPGADAESPDRAAPAALDDDTRAAWEALPKPDDAAARQQMQQRWDALQARAVAPAPEHAEPQAPAAQSAEPSAGTSTGAPADAATEPTGRNGRPPAPREAPLDPDALRAQLEQLEEALEAGQLAQADAAARQIKAALGSRTLEGRLDARLQRAQARLGDLRGWAQWGATKKREDLIEAAAQLRSTVAAGTHNVEHLAVAIPALREEWKRLNAQGPAGKGQWESFDRALEQAYVPVAAFHAEESERRSQARAAREALLAQWEAELAAIDWQHPDPAAIDARREGMLAQWRAAPHAGYRDERLLRTRFDTLVRALDQQVDAARAAEVQRREALIAAVAALAEVADLRQAGAQAKELQERWRTEAGPMRLRRGEEQKLWQRFRAGCDAVFARRDAERAAQVAQRQERQQARAALLEAFAAVLESAAADSGAAGDADGLRRALAQFRTDWDASVAEAGESAALAGSQERQARDLQRQAVQSLLALQRAAIHARYAALAQQAAASAGLDAAALEQGRAAREELLIDLEIALGLATPGASAEVRRRRQLEQLQNRFRAGPAPAAREQNPQKLLASWYGVAAPADATQDERIALVVRTLIDRDLAALEKRESESSRPARPAARSGPRPDPRAAQRPRR